jgi:hypothetical protein
MLFVQEDWLPDGWRTDAPLALEQCMQAANTALSKAYSTAISPLVEQSVMPVFLAEHGVGLCMQCRKPGFFMTQGSACYCPRHYQPGITPGVLVPSGLGYRWYTITEG